MTMFRRLNRLGPALLFTSCLGCSQGQQAQSFSPAASASESRSLRVAAAETPAPTTTDETAKPVLSKDLLALFHKIDELGRASVGNAKFVKVTFSTVTWRDHNWSKLCWLIAQSDKTVTLMEDDLVPWVYRRQGTTRIPSSWNPADVKIKAIENADFSAYCEGLSHPQKPPDDESRRVHRTLYGPGPSEKVLVAHAAWKKGKSGLALRILSTEPKYRQDFNAYRQDVLEDLAWLHFLRAVNLLMFADRSEVLAHLKLVSQLSPQGKFAPKADDLAKHMQRLIAKAKTRPKAPTDDKTPDDTARARRLLSQLVDLRCVQISQPGDIDPYMAVVNDRPFPLAPTRLLVGMGMKVVPLLIEALDDQTPTRTVYHWRDFAHDRLVWRVSDFAWFMLRDITKKDFGNRPVGGFTFTSMSPEERRMVIDEIKRWYATNKEQSPDDRMFGFFSSPTPNDWTTAALYFLRKRDKRAVAPLLEKIPHAGNFVKGDLCELVAKFGDQSTRPVIRTILQTAQEPADRMQAAIALWELGDDSGVPVAINYLKAKDQPYGNWEEPIWFLMYTRNAEAMKTLKAMVLNPSAPRVGEIVHTIVSSITGDLWGKERKSAASVEICPVLIAAMGRTEPSGETINNVQLRIKDIAARAFAMMRQGLGTEPHREPELDRTLFNEQEPDQRKRDAEIDSLRRWYDQHKERLLWDAKSRKLVIKEK